MTTKYRTVTCQSCEVLVINNHICHETGCPDAWRDAKLSCKWCGTEYTPEDKYHQFGFCSDDCAEAYNS